MWAFVWGVFLLVAGFGLYWGTVLRWPDEPIEWVVDDEKFGSDSDVYSLPETDYGVDERGYEALHVLDALPAEVEALAYSDPLGYEIASSLWEWERMSVMFFNRRIDEALEKFGTQPVVSLVKGEPTSLWAIDTAKRLQGAMG